MSIVNQIPAISALRAAMEAAPKPGPGRPHLEPHPAICVHEPRDQPHRRTPRRTHSLTTIIDPPPELQLRVLKRIQKWG